MEIGYVLLFTRMSVVHACTSVYVSTNSQKSEQEIVVFRICYGARVSF
jgi:hypothetical protein